MKTALATLCLAAAALAPVTALAQTPGTFGDQGQLAISSDADFALTGSSYTNQPGSSFELLLAPGADYFVIPNLSLGVFIEYQHRSDSSGGQTTNSDTFGIGPRIGYNIRLTDSFSFWPKAFFSFATASASDNGQSATNNATAVGIFAPFLFHPAAHFFLGIGPTASVELSNSNSQGNVSTDGGKATQYGLAFTLGGWVGL